MGAQPLMSKAVSMPVSTSVRSSEPATLASRIVGEGLWVVPEGRQVFPEMTVIDYIRLGAFGRSHTDVVTMS